LKKFLSNFDIVINIFTVEETIFFMYSKELKRKKILDPLHTSLKKNHESIEDDIFQPSEKYLIRFYNIIRGLYVRVR